MRTVTRTRYRHGRRWKISEVWVPLADRPYCQRRGWRYCRHYERREDIGALWQLITTGTCDTAVCG